MGGSTDFSRIARGIGTFGLSEVPGVSGIAQNLSFLSPTYGLAAGLRTVGGFQTMQRAPGEAARQLAKAEQNQADQAAQMNRNLLQQPKVIAPDNFLATKASQLAKLRLGLASTMTIGSPSATLSVPSLQAAGTGKNKLGA